MPGYPRCNLRNLVGTSIFGNDPHHHLIYHMLTLASPTVKNVVAIAETHLVP